MMEGVRVPGYLSCKEGKKLRVRPDPLGPSGTQPRCEACPTVFYLRSSWMVQGPRPFQEGVRPSACREKWE